MVFLYNLFRYICRPCYPDPWVARSIVRDNWFVHVSANFYQHTAYISRWFWMENDDQYKSKLMTSNDVKSCQSRICLVYGMCGDEIVLHNVSQVITGMLGITLSYHRQLAHLSFKSPKAPQLHPNLTKQEKRTARSPKRITWNISRYIK